jgi:hypothetical protein
MAQNRQAAAEQVRMAETQQWKSNPLFHLVYRPVVGRADTITHYAAQA